MLGKSSLTDFVGAELQTIKRADKKTQKRRIIFYWLLRSKTFSIKIHFSPGKALGNIF